MTQQAVSVAEPTETPARGSRPSRWGPRQQRRAFDVTVVVVLVVIGFLVRRDGLPTDGLFLDDAWVATGAIYGHVSNLITVGSAHPGFTLLLMTWHAVGGGSLRSLSFPAFVAGVAAAPLVYLGLRSFGYERSICCLLAAIVVVSDVHIQQSGRVKGYTIDVLLVLLLAVALPRLARVRWRWPLALAWIVVAMLVGAMSGTVLLASIVAGLVLFLHPQSDRPVRFAALAIQCVGLGLLYLAEVRATNLDDIEKFMKRAYDAHISFSLNPLDFGSDVLKHLGRVARVYPGGSGPWLASLGLAAVAGLVLASIRSTHRAELLAARFFGLLVAIAFVGAVLGRFPFGTSSGGFLATSSDGGRYTLWLLPAFAFGLAALLQRVRNVVAKRPPSLTAFRAVLVGAAVVVVVAGYQDAKPYPQSGSASATAFVESTVRPGDVVIVAGGVIYSFAVSAHLPLELEPTPEHQIGFTPVFDDPTYRTFGEWSQQSGTPKQIRAAVGNARRVLLYGSLFGSPAVNQVVRTLNADGFRNESITPFGGVNSVFIWSR
jgi:hypothetical protein